MGKLWVKHSFQPWFKDFYNSADDPMYKKIRKAYSHMIDRCYNPKDKAYQYYGAKGIKVCDRWLGIYGFKHFVIDMYPITEISHSIDRVNTYGDYEPSNCRWADKKTQMTNTTRNVFHIYNGKKMTVTDIARLVGINHQTVFQRMHGYGWSVDKAINTPVRKRG